jgi:tetratricopeptide (TPR) repeat protein
MSRTFLKKLAIFSLLLMSLGVFSQDAYSQSKKDRRKAEQLIKDGDAALRQKNFQDAVTKYSEALTILPNNSGAHFQKGQAHYFLGEYDQATAEFDLALKNGQKPVEVFKIRWMAYDKQKKYDEALADVNSLLASDSGNYQLHLAAADIYYNKGAHKEAADAYLKAAPKAPNSADIYYRIADAKSKLGDLEGQATAAQEAIKRNTQFLADALLLLGQARYAQKRIPEAIDAYSRALTARPDKLESYRHLAELHRSQNQIDEGIKTLESGRRLNATNGEVYKDLSLFYSLAEKNDEAIAAGKSATQLLPTDPIAHTNLCRAYYQAKKPELAVGSCNSALRLAPEDGESLFYLGRSTLELKKPAEAEKYSRRALASFQTYTKDKPEDADGFYMLGNAYADLQQNANALEAYRKALELNPKLTRAYYNIGVIQLNEKNKAGALEQYNALLTTDKALAEKLKALIDTL